MEEKKKTVSVNSTPIAIILVGLMISAAIFFGLKSNNPSSKQVLGEAGELEKPDNLPAEPVPNQIVETSIDDDPILGDRDLAQVAIVEFSDYECPFCKRFRDQTFDQIKSEYLDTGKAILVYRDLPLPFHNPAAEREAMAAECAREQGGDSKYFEYHDLIFAKSPGNGQGLSIDQLSQISSEIGLNGDQVKNCIQENKYKDEVAQDAASAAKAGINGTPGFVVGKLSDNGSVKGIVISGAQPFSVFKETIEGQLD